MSISCDPSSLMQAAACFDKCDSGSQGEIKTYLLCQAAAAGQFGGPPTSTGFSFTISADGLTVTTSWNAPAAGVTKTEIWTSSDNITFALEVTVLAPGTSSTAVTPPTVGNTKYGKIRWCSATACGNFTASQSVSVDVINDWVRRVMVNGGAQPSNNTINTARTFYNSLVSNNLWSHMYMVNMIAPDSVIACKTPLLVPAGGRDPWIAAGGGVTVDGWLGTTNSLQTGFNPSTFFSTTNAGWSVYMFAASPASLPDVGTACIGCRTTGAARFYMCNPSSANLWYGWCFTNDGSSLLAQAFVTHNAGLWSLVRRANNILEAYRGQATFAPGTMELEYSTAVVGTASPPNAEWYFGGENVDGVDTVDSNRRLSFCALHDGFTGAQLQTLYTAVDALRLGFGGGRV